MHREMMLFLGSLLFGWFYFRRTGWGSGGMVTPGFLVLHRNFLPQAIGLVLVGVALAFPLEIAVRRFGLFGRERLFAACVLSLGVLGMGAFWFPGNLHWYGWIIPGLVGAECQRQGIFPTIMGLGAVWGASAALGELL